MKRARYSNAYNLVNRENFLSCYSFSDTLSCMTVGDRIKERLDRLGIKPTELARRVGVSQPTIHALINGNAQGSKHLHKIAAELGTSPAYLAGETDDDTPVSYPPSALDALSDKLDLAMIPEFEIGLSMGGGTEIAEVPQIGIVPFQRAWLRSMMRGSFADLFVARGDGDSMMPTILDEDFVLVDTSQRSIMKQDRIWAISYGGLGIIKRVRGLPNGKYEINSDNPNVTPIYATDEEMHVIGRVIWIGRRM